MIAKIRENVPLSPRTTLEVGGPARYWLEAHDMAALQQALSWARGEQLTVQVLGAGSNVVVADRGLEALVLRACFDELQVRVEEDSVWLEAGAAVRWDDLVHTAVDHDGGGMECLAGIPGEVGAAPIQNVGAYGQEVATSIETVRVVDLETGAASSLSNDECSFGYRHSVFKAHARDRFVVVGVDFRLSRGAKPELVYPELCRAVEQEGQPPSLAAVRQAVLRLRRAKSMLAEPDDPNRRSVGSFFVNPTIPPGAFTAVERAAALALGRSESIPHHPTGDGRVKVPAGWLIERAGLPKGTTRGRVGLSTAHCLAIINRGGATAAEIVAFAVEVRNRVRDRFGVALTPEPRLLGFEADELAPLTD